MRELGTAQLFKGGEYVSWIDPVRCDEHANLYLLLAPHASVSSVEAAAKKGRDLPLIPRKVLRISADGKRTTFDPAVSPKLATAKTLTTTRIAVGDDGALYLLVWATWVGKDGETEKSGQYILSFSEKGKYSSQVEVNWEGVTVRQFEVFGSGGFLLVGHHIGADEWRVAVLDGSGTPRGVPGWPATSAGLVERTARTKTILWDHMVRGGDGRIYLAEQDPRLEDVAVYAFQPLGGTSQILTLRPMQKRQLSGLRAAGNRIAAVYREASPDGQRTRSWIAIFDTLVGSSEVISLYGPVPTEPICYQLEGSEDRFLSLAEGKLVTMAGAVQ